METMLESNPEPVKNKRRKTFRSKKRKKTLSIVFDENARREFLTGFHKRKLQRRNKAKEDFERQLKAERKRIKAEAKEQYMKLLLAQKPIPEISDLLSENVDMGTHSVSVTELSAADLARKNNWIGLNEVQYHKEEESEKEEEQNKSNNYRNKQKLEGMDMKKKGKNKSTHTINTIKSCKDIKKQIKQQATASVKKSKIFQKKSQLEKIKNFKLKRREERKLGKIRKKDKRSKHKNTHYNK